MVFTNSCYSKSEVMVAMRYKTVKIDATRHLVLPMKGVVKVVK